MFRKVLTGDSSYSDRTETSMLILAAVSIGLYLFDLNGYWEQTEYLSIYHHLSNLIDIIFVIDLCIKTYLNPKTYLKSPWFIIDLISVLPVLGLYFPMTDSEGLRFVRGFRFFRVLRTLRTLKTLKFFEGFSEVQEIEESNTFRFITTFSVIMYALTFTIITQKIEGDQANLIEFYLVFGSLLGMGLVLVVVSAMLPDISNKQVHSLLHLFLPSQLADQFFTAPDEYHKTIRAEATIIFCDIKGFTKTVETLDGDLDTLKSHLEKALDAITYAHECHDLIIDKFIGDAVMSFRGGPFVVGDAKDHAYRVVKAALASEKALGQLADSFFNEVKIGGASSRGALIGTVGTRSRLSYTILGDKVNLAARLEAAVSQCGTRNLFCEITMNLTEMRGDLIWRSVGSLNVQGKRQTTNAYEVFDRADTEDWTWISVFHAALKLYQERAFSEAHSLFSRADQLRGGDPLSQNYLTLCETYIETPPPEEWLPIFETHK